jgi:hypothetical protein
VPDEGLQVPDAELPVPELRVIVQSVVEPWATVTVSVLGMGTPFPAVTVAENTKPFSEPQVMGLPLTVKLVTWAVSGPTVRPIAPELEAAKGLLPR